VQRIRAGREAGVLEAERRPVRSVRPSAQPSKQPRCPARRPADLMGDRSLTLQQRSGKAVIEGIEISLAVANNTVWVSQGFFQWTGWPIRQLTKVMRVRSERA
jgi:hypothetical protein